MGHRKKPLDFVGNPDRITFWLQLGWVETYPQHWVCFMRRLLHSNHFVGPVALTGYALY